MNHQPVTLAPPPLSRTALELTLTGSTIHGHPGTFGDAIRPGFCAMPAGPYVVTDAAGDVVGTVALSWQAKSLAIRAWRARCEASNSDAYTFAGVQQQAALKTRIRRLEVEIARCEAEDEAIGFAHGDHVELLDRALDRYADALRDLEAAQRDEEAQAEYAEAQTRSAA